MALGRTTLALMAALAVTAGVSGFYFSTRGEDPGATAPASVAVTQTEETLEPVEAAGPGAAAHAEPPPAARPAPRVEPRPVARPRPVATREPAVERTAPRPEPAPVAVAAPPPAADTRSALPASILLPPAVEPEPPRLAEPPAPEFVDLIVPADSVVGLQLETSLTSETARVEDDVVARVTRDVRVGDRVAIPAGARAHGEVTLVERGGRLKDRARLGVRFTSVVLADGTRVPLETETIYREGDAPGGESAAKIGGGAIGGAIIGGILGGTRGAAIGGSIGAGAGTAATLAGGRNPATLPTGTPVTVRVLTPTTVTVEQ